MPKQTELFEPKTKKYQVAIPEIHYSYVNIEVPANFEEEEIFEAAEKSLEEDGPDDMEYSHLLDYDQWNYREI